MQEHVTILVLSSCSPRSIRYTYQVCSVSSSTSISSSSSSSSSRSRCSSSRWNSSNVVDNAINKGVKSFYRIKYLVRSSCSTSSIRHTYRVCSISSSTSSSSSSSSRSRSRCSGSRRNSSNIVDNVSKGRTKYFIVSCTKQLQYQ